MMQYDFVDQTTDIDGISNLETKENMNLYSTQPAQDRYAFHAKIRFSKMKSTCLVFSKLPYRIVICSQAVIYGNQHRPIVIH